jgi:hypothetical protein
MKLHSSNQMTLHKQHFLKSIKYEVKMEKYKLLGFLANGAFPKKIQTF